MAGNAAKAYDHSGMLYGVIPIEKPGSRNAHILPLAESQHFFYTVPVNQLRIIVEQQQVFTLCKGNSIIVDGRIIEALLPGKGFLLGTVVFHDNEFQVPVR